MTIKTIAQKQADLYEMHPFGFLAVDANLVNLDDLLSARPGAIVRCFGQPSELIAWFPPAESYVGCIAGWISEDD